MLRPAAVAHDLVEEVADEDAADDDDRDDDGESDVRCGAR